MIAAVVRKLAALFRPVPARTIVAETRAATIYRATPRDVVSLAFIDGEVGVEPWSAARLLLAVDNGNVVHYAAPADVRRPVGFVVCGGAAGERAIWKIVVAHEYRDSEIPAALVQVAIAAGATWALVPERDLLAQTCLRAAGWRCIAIWQDHYAGADAAYVFQKAGTPAFLRARARCDGARGG